jgi:hypothetical protein
MVMASKKRETKNYALIYFRDRKTLKNRMIRLQEHFMIMKIKAVYWSNCITKEEFCW